MYRTFAVPQPRELAGELHDAAGVRLAAWKMRVACPGFEREAITDANGRFTFGTVPAGECRLHMAKAGYLPPEVRCDAAACTVNPLVQLDPNLKPE